MVMTMMAAVMPVMLPDEFLLHGAVKLHRRAIGRGGFSSTGGGACAEHGHKSQQHDLRFHRICSV